jgi:hypothetical protein
MASYLLKVLLTCRKGLLDALQHLGQADEAVAIHVEHHAQLLNLAAWGGMRVHTVQSIVAELRRTVGPLR